MAGVAIPKAFYELQAERPTLTPAEYRGYVVDFQKTQRKAKLEAKRRSDVAERAYWRDRLHEAAAAGLTWPAYAAKNKAALADAPEKGAQTTIARIASIRAARAVGPREYNTGNSSPPPHAPPDLAFVGVADLEQVPVSAPLPAPDPARRVTPSTEVKALKGDDLLWYITEAVRPFGRERQAKCMHTFVGHGFKAKDKMNDTSKNAPEVWVEVDEDGGAHSPYYTGLLRCDSDNECPRCMAQNRPRTAEQLTAAVADNEKKYGKGSVLFDTHTFRHKLSDNGKKNRDGVMRAWAYVQSGEPWRRFCSAHGLHGGYRAVELTYRRYNEDGTDGGGWHPHLHNLLLLDHVPTKAELAEMCDWLADRWKRGVAKALGAKHLPNDERGTVLVNCHAADYLSKLGLKPEKNLGRELSSTGLTKRLSRSRSPMQIAADFALYRDPADALLWMDACDIMRSTKVLHPFGDAELIEDEEEPGEADGRKLVFSFDQWTWERIRNIEFAKPTVLKAALKGREEVERVVAELVAKAPPADVSRMRTERRQC